jgi:hypothetical protein
MARQSAERATERVAVLMTPTEKAAWGYLDSVDRSQGLTDLSLRVLTNCCS